MTNYFKVESALPRSGVLSTEPCPMEQPFKVTAKDVRLAINNMKRGKSPGHDGLSIEHLRHAGPHMYRVLSLLFTFCVRHSYLPPNLMKTVVIHLVKNRMGDTADKTNHRPTSLATVTAKILDRILDVYLGSRIKLHDSQFGFREGLSTASAILSLKYAVDYYINRKTST